MIRLLHQVPSCCRGAVHAAVRLRLGERGAVAVEFALIVPVLIALFFGIVQFGLLFSVHSGMQNATREAARAVALLGEDHKGGKDIAVGLLPNWPSQNEFDVNVCTPTNQGSACSGNSSDEIQVIISVPMDKAAVVDALGLFGGQTLTASTSMRQE